ncbi:MAG TPA: glycoside hydrolase family 88 protein [Tepidisphaeraceae bacterium]|nr:glycoside hydrolase family 88 protein [Tepidisphaeraceae bacterium]
MEFWGAWPQGADPKEMGSRAVRNLIARPTMASQAYGLIYPEVCTGYGSVRFAATIKDKALLEALVTRYQGMLNPPGGHAPPAGGAGAAAPAGGRGRGQRGGQGRGGAATRGADGLARGDGNRGPTSRGAGGGQRGVSPAAATALNMIPVADHVDRSVFGILPMEIYRQTGDARYLPIGKKSADDQWVNPDENGLTRQSRFWADDMFMIISLQTEAYRVTKDPVYLDRAAKEVSAYLDRIQQPNGLFYHSDDVKFYWGRGDGWFAVGMAELLSELPENHPQRARVMEGYKKMMAGLLKYQAPNGMWRQLIDHEESWPETSGTGMFTFAMATGVRKGWLDAATYKEPVRKAWIGLCSYVDADGNVKDVSVGTNAYTISDAAFYNDRPRALGDLHGQAAFTWAAYAMVR